MANLLPGLRELRAPLAAGYLWLVGLWLLFHDEVHKRHASGAIDAGLAIRDQLGPAGFISAATFLAYLVGSLWEPIGQLLAEAGWKWYTKLRLALRRNLLFEELFPRLARKAARAQFIRVSPTSWDRLSAIGIRLFGDVDEIVRERLEVSKSEVDDVYSAWLGLKTMSSRLHYTTLEANDEYRAPRARPYDMEQDIMDLSFVGSPRERWWVREAANLFDEVPLGDLREGMEWEPDRPLVVLKYAHKLPALVSELRLQNTLFDELPLGAHRLVGEHQELFLEASRMKGEVEFRLAVWVPLVFAVAVAALGLDLSTAVAATCIGVAGAAGLALLFDGFRRDRRRNDFLVELLAIGRAGSPTFDRLFDRAKAQATRRSELDEVYPPYGDAALGDGFKNPKPTISGVSPPLSTSAEILKFILHGKGFSYATTASAGRHEEAEEPMLGPRIRRFMSETELEITLLSEDLAQPGQLWISVANPDPGGGTAGPIAFDIE